ncbi:MAG: DUF2007 domain-containing protein [Gammaproteobacteria bacterium]
MTDNRIIPIKAYSTRMDADLAKAVLEANGIDAIVSADDAGGMEPWLALSQHIQILVREEDATVARDLLAESPPPASE